MAFDAGYREFVVAQPGATLWHDPDFLEALAPDSDRSGWNAALVEASGKIVGALPYFRKQRPDGWVVTLPALVRYCGPLVDSDWAEAVGPERAFDGIFGALPSGYRSFDQTWPRLPGTIEFDSFQYTTRTTHRIDLRGKTVPELQSDQSRNMRSDLRRAGRHFEIRFAEALSVDIHEALEAPFARQGIPVPYRRKSLEDTFALLRKRGRICCTCAYGPDGGLGAASLFVGGDYDAYALVTGSKAAARRYNGGSLVLWRGTTWALEAGMRQLDYLGSDHPGIAANLRHLGGQPAEYVHVHRDRAFWTKALRRWRGRTKND